MSEIDALAVERRADGDKRHLALDDGLLHLERSAQTLADVSHEELVEPALEDGRFPAIDGVDLVLVDVDARDFVAFFGKADARDEAHVADAENRDLH
jgi:hypothetical protein